MANPVQHRTTTVAGGSSSASLAYSSATVLNNRSIAGCGIFPNTVTVSSVTDNGTTPNSYHADKSLADAGTGDTADIRSANIATNPSSGNLSVTWNFTGGTVSGGDVYLHEVSGLTTAANPVDTTGSNTATGSGSLAITTAANCAATGEWVYGIVIQSIGGTETAGSGTTLIDSDGANGSATGYLTALSTGGSTATVNFNCSGTQTWAGIVVAYLLAPSTAGAVRRAIRPGPVFRRHFYRTWQHPRPRFDNVAQVTPLALAGESDGVSTFAATVSIASALAGASRSYTSLTATATVTVALSGTMAAYSSVTASVSVAKTLSGTVASVSVATGTASVAEALSGSVQSAATLAATSALAEALSGTVASAAALSGQASAAVALSSAVTAISGVSGNLSVTTGNPISGVVTAQSVMVATLSEALALVGAMAGLSGLSGTTNVPLPDTMPSAMATPLLVAISRAASGAIATPLGPSVTASRTSPIATPVQGPVTTRK